MDHELHHHKLAYIDVKVNLINSTPDPLRRRRSSNKIAQAPSSYTDRKHSDTSSSSFVSSQSFHPPLPPIRRRTTHRRHRICSVAVSASPER